MYKETLDGQLPYSQKPLLTNSHKCVVAETLIEI